MCVYCDPSIGYLENLPTLNSLISTEAKSCLDVDLQLIQNKSPITIPLSPSPKKFSSIAAKSHTYNSHKMTSEQYRIKQRLLVTPKHVISSAKKADLIRRNLAKSKKLVNQMELIKKELRLIAENIILLENLN